MTPGEDRYEYAKGELTEETAGDDPIGLFERWLQDAKDAKVVEPAAFCLATADADGAPDARFVLLREFDARGLVFFSHYNGRKGQEMAANPRAAAVFWWGALERQIRLEGPIEIATEAESDEYWITRPPKSRIASAASPQSQTVASREELESLVARETERNPDGLPRPEYWGGTRLIPTKIEFWQGRRSRLHDRLLFERDEDGWRRCRLAP